MDWAAELYAHAIAIEREAALRYAELAWRMIGQGSDEMAQLFGEFAGLQATHLAALQRRTRGIALPDLTADHSWPQECPPLERALQAEKAARAFFEQAHRIAREPAARALAEEMTQEQNDHIARIERLMGSNACSATS